MVKDTSISSESVESTLLNNFIYVETAMKRPNSLIACLIAVIVL